MPLERKTVALVPAGQRSAEDPVAKATGVTTKALTPVAGTPMIIRVLNALQATGRIDTTILIGPDQAAIKDSPQLQQYINQPDITWTPARDTLSASIQAGLAEIDPEAQVLIVPADHALVDAEILNHFLDQTTTSQADVNVALVEYARIQQTYPGAHRTILKFTEGNYCGCNLYALNNPQARNIITHWQRTQEYRKHPWRMINGLFGFGMLSRYLLGCLSVGQAKQTIKNKTGISLDFIYLPYPNAGIDVDTPADLDLAEQILRG